MGGSIPAKHEHTHKHEKKKKSKLIMKRNLKFCMIYPENKHKDNWDIFMALVLIMSCLISPVRIAFHQKQESEGWKIYNMMVDIMFLIDIIVVFNTAYYDKDFHIIDCRKHISKGYLKGWFMVDVLAIVPFDMFFETSKESTHLVRFARIGKLYKLVKLTRLLRIIKFLKD